MTILTNMERGKLLSRGWLTLCALFFLTHAAPAQTASKEYQVKAAFLYNFPQFVEWPATAFPEAQSPLVIGILGEDPFGRALDEILHDEKVNNHPLVVQRYRRLEDIKTCHILFISYSEAAQLDKILKGVKGRSILTVSEIEGFAKRGGIIRFITENNKIRFRINFEAAKAANLIISSKLLKMSEITATINSVGK